MHELTFLSEGRPALTNILGTEDLTYWISTTQTRNNDRLAEITLCEFMCAFLSPLIILMVLVLYAYYIQA